MSVIRQLYQLQLLDNEWDQTTERLERVMDTLGATGDVERAQQAVAESERNVGELRKKLNALELEVGGLAAKLAANQELLYGGRVRNPKELRSLQDEAASLRRRQSELEDDELELMILAEEEEAELAERQARQRQIEANWRQEQGALKIEREQLGAHRNELEQERADLRARISAAQLERYEDLRARTNGSPIAQLKNGICQSCGVGVPTGVVREVERGIGQHDCPVCGRLLLYAGG
jgi:predicted  nucleic acid-binding Zn-ribbon protein